MTDLPVPDPLQVAEALNELLRASHRAVRAFGQRRGTKSALAAKRRAVDRLYRSVFGRRATAEEHRAAGTDCFDHYG